MDTGSAALAINSARAKLFANFSNVMLADEMGAIDRQIDVLKAREKAAREEMTRRKLNSIEGARFIIVKSVTETATLDSKGVRTEMGDDWYEARQKAGSRTTYTAIEKSQDPEVTPASARVAAEALFKAPSP